MKQSGGKQILPEVKLQRDVIKGEPLLSRLYVVAMVSFKYNIRKCTKDCEFTKSKENIYYLTYKNSKRMYSPKMKKKNEDPGTNNRIIQSVNRNGIWH